MCRSDSSRDDRRVRGSLLPFYTTLGVHHQVDSLWVSGYVAFQEISVCLFQLLDGKLKQNWNVNRIYIEVFL